MQKTNTAGKNLRLGGTERIAGTRALAVLRNYRVFPITAILFALAGGLIPAANAQYLQQGPKLYGTGAVSSAQQGYSVAISADGNTAIAGGPGDNPTEVQGAAWVYTRVNGVWGQQGAKLSPSDDVAPGNAGWSVALSADGNTALIGAPNDNASQFTGGAWVFVRSNGVWTQQQKLVGTLSRGSAHQGVAVALSGDGKTAIVGGPADNGFVGAAWVFTANSGNWIQQQKLTVQDASGAAQVGFSTAISGDGSTIILGGPTDAAIGSNAQGAAWIFTFSNGSWTQQGAKLVGRAPFMAQQGYAVALSSDGSVAAIGGPLSGGAWVFTRASGVWTSQAGPLAGANGGPQSGDGNAVALSGDGNTLVVGGPGNNDAWIFRHTKSGWTSLQELTLSPQPDGVTELPVIWMGFSAAMSGDGGTVILGGPKDSTASSLNLGAAWIFSAGAASIKATAGTSQAAQLGAAFSTNFKAIVTDSQSNPVGGVTVTFSAPANGASGTFPGASLTATAVSDSSGSVQAPVFTANTIGGTYTVSASAPGTSTPATYSLTNSAATSANITLQTSPANLLVSFDNGALSPAPLTINVAVGSIHTIATQSPQPVADGTQNVFASWSDGMPLSHSITVPASDTTYTATFLHNGTAPSGQYAQQGGKLSAIDVIGFPTQGDTVALSADGSTAAVGGPSDGYDGSNPVYPGAVWIWTQSNGVWTVQQKLSASDAVSTQQFGRSVSLSADGNTLIVGGPGHFEYGAAWIFIRNNQVWSQKQKLQTVGQGVSIDDSLGWSVAISGDGNTAIVGSPQHSFGFGSAWIFVRNPDDTWRQQAQIYGSNVTGSIPQQGYAVGISDDGNTVIMGVPGSTPLSGALIFKRASDGSWSQQGGLLSDPTMPGTLQGESVAISGDGQTVLVATPNNQNNPGLASVYTLVNGLWTQQGMNLAGPISMTPQYLANYVSLSRDGNFAVIGGGGDIYAAAFMRSGGVWSASGQISASDVSGATAFGLSAAISADAGTIIVGGPGDNNYVGAAWVFKAVPANATASSR